MNWGRVSGGSDMFSCGARAAASARRSRIEHVPLQRDVDGRDFALGGFWNGNVDAVPLPSHLDRTPTKDWLPSIEPTGYQQTRHAKSAYLLVSYRTLATRGLT